MSDFADVAKTVSLWDVSCKDYHLRDKREKAYADMKAVLEISVAEIKQKSQDYELNLAEN